MHQAAKEEHFVVKEMNCKDLMDLSIFLKVLFYIEALVKEEIVFTVGASFQGR
jgi:hypothetical protein